ncbi:MAG TPA: hypothetical protein ENK57_07870 [Polyangiaceae bacterium]|nr:hypothetical protein [Polyangiaceae bacterium]
MRHLVTLLVLLAGCGSDTSPNPTPAPAPLAGTLELELRDTAIVTVTPTDGDRATIEIVPSADFGLLGSEALTATGFVERYPEANSTMYTAKYEVAAQADGPCGSEPISVALALHRQGSNAIVIGGLSAYCGAGKHHGIPVRVLRLAGDLPL